MMTDAVKHVPFEETIINDLLHSWHNQWPEMGVVALVPEAERNLIPLLQTLCRQQNIPLAGAVFPALITDESWNNSGIWLLRLNRQPPVFLFENVSAQSDSVQNMAEQLDQFIDLADHSGKPTLFMIFDAMMPDIGCIVDGLYLRLADGVHYSGLNAGSETFQPIPCLFDETKLIQNGALCLLLPAWASMLLEHGYPAPEKVISATSAEGNRITNIDWQPAFDVYKQLIHDECGAELTPDNFYQYACYFPFGILQANNEVMVRIPIAVDDDGTIICVGDVPANASLVLLRAPSLQESQCVKQLSYRLQTDMSSTTGWPLLTFYCAARRIHLEGDTLKELASLKKSTGATRLAGALSLGEIGSRHVWGYPMFHSAALLCGSWKY